MDQPGDGVARRQQLVKIFPPQVRIPKAGDSRREGVAQLFKIRQRADGQLVVGVIVQKGDLRKDAQGLRNFPHHRALASRPQDQQVHPGRALAGRQGNLPLLAVFFQHRHALRPGEKIFPETLQNHIGLADAHIKAQGVKVHARLDAPPDKGIAQIHGRQGGCHAPPLVHGAEHVLHHVKGRQLPAPGHDEAVPLRVKPRPAQQEAAHMGRHGQPPGQLRGGEGKAAAGLHRHLPDLHRAFRQVDLPPAQGADLREHQPHVQAEVGAHLPRLHAPGQLLFN